MIGRHRGPSVDTTRPKRLPLKTGDKHVSQTGAKPAEPIIDDAAERFPRRTARRQQTRARILDAALAEFQRVGYADATMNAIAAAADIHVTTLFTHFKAKRELAETLAEAELQDLQERVEAAQGKQPFFAFFRDIVLSAAKERQTKGDHKRGISRESLQEPELVLHWVRYQEREVRLLAGYIAADYRLDLATDLTPILAADALVASGVHSYARWRRARGTLDLVAETAAALDIAEKMARAVLPESR